MNKLKFISMMFCGMALLGFNSCLGDDDDDIPVLTPEQKQEKYLMVAGYHGGKVIYPAKNPEKPQDQTDTTNCQFYISHDYDTENDKTVYTVTINNVPISALAEYMSYGEQRDAVKAYGTVNLECDMDFVYIDNASINAAWLINPYPAELNVTYGEKTHKLEVLFYANNTNSMGAMGTVSNKEGVKKKQIQMWVTAGAIYADGKQTAWLNQPVQFYFVADV